MKDPENLLKKLQSEVDSLNIALKEKENFCVESRQRFEKALMASQDSVCILNLDNYTILKINNHFEEHFGYSPKQVIGKTSLMMNFWVNPEDRNRIIKEVQQSGSISNFETDLNKKNGNTCKVSISAEKIIYEGTECLLAYFKQITELRKTESLYSLLAENSTDVIWILRLDGTFSYVSPSVEKLRGFKPEEVIEQSMEEVMTESSSQKVKILMQTFMDQDQKGAIEKDSFKTEIEQICKDGSTVWTEVIATPIRNDDGQVKEILGVSRNIKGKKIAEQKAAERLNTVEGILRSAPLGIGMLIDRKFKMVNDQFCKMLGYSRKEIIGRSSRIIYESNVEFDRVGKLKYDEIRISGIGQIQTRIRKKDGSVFDVLISSSPIDQSNFKKGVVFSILDLSATKEAESRLALNEKKYDSYFNHINDAILVHPWKNNGSRNFIEANNIACELYGYTKDELLKLGPSDISISKAVINNSKKYSSNNPKKKGSRIFEVSHIRKDGTSFPAEISSNIIKIENQTLILSVVRDISERKKAREALEESEQNYREMFENSPEAMLIIDKLGFVTNCNKVFYQLSGRKPEELINKHFAKLGILPAKNLPKYLKLFTELIIKKENHTVELEWISHVGENRTAAAHCAPIIQNNKIKGLQILMKDTTAQKEFEDNLIKAKEKAEESDRLKTSFLETMSHELRTPLNAVIGFSNLINDENNIQAVKEMNTYVSENGKKLLNIIESIFDISLLENKSTILKDEEFALKDLFEELEITLKSLIQLDHKKDIATYYQPDRRNEEFRIKSDRHKLKQLLSNLLINAAKYTDKGSIRYGFSVRKNEIEFFVADTGIGIPPGRIDDIFNKFIQVDCSATRTRGGLGLGLSIVNEIAKLLGGQVRVDSVKNIGSTFYFNLPLNDKNIKNAGFGLDLTDRNILIVEDIESNYLYLEKLLTESGATVLWAQTGEDAISIVEKLEKIDLVLMDIRIPDMDGYAITRKIKELRPEVPVIAQTAYAMSGDKEEAIDAGCVAHISKPIRVNDLMDAISKHLQLPKAHQITI